MTRSIRQIVALALLTVYAPFVATLDFHHNHSGKMLWPGERVVEDASNPAVQAMLHNDPCPVQQFTLSHAPVHIAVFDQDAVRVETSIPGVQDLVAELYSAPPSQRAPPRA